MPRGPYVLRSGKFKGKAIETLMFSAKGYAFLAGVARMAETDANRSFLRRVRSLIELGKNPEIKVFCKCGRPVAFISVKIERSDIGFIGLCCAECRCSSNGYSYVPLKFSSVLNFSVVMDQQRFLRYLKQACGLAADERMTAQKAHDFFYPPCQVAKAKQLELPF